MEPLVTISDIYFDSDSQSICHSVEEVTLSELESILANMDDYSDDVYLDTEDDLPF